MLINVVPLYQKQGQKREGTIDEEIRDAKVVCKS